MDFDNILFEYFGKYEELSAQCSLIFDKFKEKYPQEIKCKIGCVDCCYALFDLTLIEAIYINRKFNEVLPEEIRSKVVEEAGTIDRKIYKIKRWAYKERQKGVPEDKILEEVGKQRIKCPLLTEENKCLMYQYRPITCRLYGLPLGISGKLKICALSGFEPGKKYQAVMVDKINQRLFELSQSFVSSIPTRYSALHEVLVPISMVLITDYNEEYLGIISCDNMSGPKGPSWTIGGNG